jgi:hypothetical protein
MKISHWMAMGQTGSELGSNINLGKAIKIDPRPESLKRKIS